LHRRGMKIKRTGRRRRRMSGFALLSPPSRGSRSNPLSLIGTGLLICPPGNILETSCKIYRHNREPDRFLSIIFFKFVWRIPAKGAYS